MTDISADEARKALLFLDPNPMAPTDIFATANDMAAASVLRCFIDQRDDLLASNNRLLSRALDAERELAQTEKFLEDPVFVHMNMMRGGIAMLSESDVYHLYPVIRDQRDAANQTIAAIAEWLNDNPGSYDSGDALTAENVKIYLNDVSTATIAALAAERDALKAENFALAAAACNVPGGLLSDEHGGMVCQKVKRIDAFAEVFEAAAICEVLGPNVSPHLLLIFSTNEQMRSAADFLRGLGSRDVGDIADDFARTALRSTEKG